MKLYILILLWSFVCFSCSTNTEPIGTVSSDYDVHIVPTGIINEYSREFSFTNITHEKLYYLGFGKTSPFYSAQIHSDSGWVPYVIWRCATGIQLITLLPSESIKTNISLPPDNSPWRVGLSVRKEPDGEDYFSWSDVQN